MRRLGAVLIAAGLAVAPSGAAAGPKKQDTWSDTEKAELPRRLGVMITPLTPELRGHFGTAKDRGVLVARVEPGSPAAAAGILVGDVLIDVRGELVDDATDVHAALAKAKLGESVRVQVVRDKKPVVLHAKVNEPLSLFDLPRFWRDLLGRPDQTASK